MSAISVGALYVYNSYAALGLVVFYDLILRGLNKYYN